MGIVGAKSTAGRAVKCSDPSKTTKSESTWLGYTLCEMKSKNKKKKKNIINNLNKENKKKLYL